MDLILQVLRLTQYFRVFFVFVLQQVVDVTFIGPLRFVVKNRGVFDGWFLEFGELVDGLSLVVAFLVVNVLLLLQRHADLSICLSWHSLRNFWVVVLPWH